MNQFELGALELKGSVDDVTKVLNATFMLCSGKKGNAVFNSASVMPLGNSGVNGIFLTFDFVESAEGNNQIIQDLAGLELPSGDYEFIELELIDGKKPSPRVIVKTYIPY